MPYAFDGRALGQVLVDTERLAAQTRDHERRLSRLVDRLEADGRTAMLDVLLEIRHLCVNTRAQRLQLEEMLARMLGDRPAGETAPASRGRVLIADDSIGQRETAARALEAAGFSVLVVANGLEALMAAHYVKPEVAVMGVSMPVLDGIEAARLLKASPSTRHVRVLAYTAWPSFYDGPLKSVFDGVLPKPSTDAELIASVSRMLHPPATRAAGG